MVLDRMLMILHDYRVVYLNDDLIFVFIYRVMLSDYGIRLSVGNS